MDSTSQFAPTHPDRLFLLAADIDGTILGDDEGEEQFRAFRRQYRACFRLAYITGRYCRSVLQLIDEGRLPAPDTICGDIGTDLIDLGDPQMSLAGSMPPK